MELGISLCYSWLVGFIQLGLLQTNEVGFEFINLSQVSDLSCVIQRVFPQVLEYNTIGLSWGFSDIVKIIVSTCRDNLGS